MHVKNKNKKTSGNLVKKFQGFETFEFKTMNGWFILFEQPLLLFLILISICIDHLETNSLKLRVCQNLVMEVG